MIFAFFVKVSNLDIRHSNFFASSGVISFLPISSIIFSFVLSIGFRKNQAFYLSLGLLFLYILMIGAQASAVRAFIMAGIWLLAEKSGRPSSGSRAVFLTAAFMLAQNPFLLANDVGFQLSFLAILGLVYFQQFFSRWLKFLPNPKIFPLKTTLAATFAAQIFTLPILIYNLHLTHKIPRAHQNHIYLRHQLRFAATETVILAKTAALVQTIVPRQPK